MGGEEWMLAIPEMGVDTGDEGLNEEILRYQNGIVEEMFDVAIDLLEGNQWEKEELMFYLPRNYVEDHPDMGRRILLDIRDLIHSRVKRRVLKPLYEYVLYQVLDEYLILMEDLYGSTKRQLPEELKERIVRTMGEHGFSTEETEFTIDMLEDLKYFYEVLFWDYDFMPDVVDSVALGVLEDRPVAEMMGIDIDQYVDIMAPDIREDFLRKREQDARMDVDDESFVVQELYSAIKILEKRTLEIESFSEAQICNYLDAMLTRIMYLKNRIIVSREEPIGFANILLGEADFFLYRQEEVYENIAIVECKFINKAFRELKQLLGYLNQNFQFGVTITINREYSLENAKMRVWEALHRHQEADERFVKNIYESSLFNNLYISEHTVPEESKKSMRIYHFILNLNQQTRKLIAKSVREPISH